MFSKMNLYETSLRAPMIVRAPGADAREVAGPVEFLDIYPTLVSLAGLPPPAIRCVGSRSLPCVKGPPLMAELRPRLWILPMCIIYLKCTH